MERLHCELGHSEAKQTLTRKLSAYVIIPCSAFLLLSCAVSCCPRLLGCCRWLLPFEVMQSHRKASIHLWAVTSLHSAFPYMYLASHLWEMYLLTRWPSGFHRYLRWKKRCLFLGVISVFCQVLELSSSLLYHNSWISDVCIYMFRWSQTWSCNRLLNVCPSNSFQHHENRK